MRGFFIGKLLGLD